VDNGSSYKTKALHTRIVTGSAVLLAGSGLTAAFNLTYNVVVAYFLGPADFAHATVVYTVLTILSAVALAFQIVSAKLVAQQKSPEGRAECYRVFHRAAWGCGLLMALVLLLFQRQISDYLKLPDPILVVLLAFGTAFFVPLGTRRGWIEGIYRFRGLSVNLTLEAALRLGGSYLMIWSGLGVRGVVAANAAAIAAAYFAAPPKLGPRASSPLSFWPAVAETGQSLSFFAGQMLITNFDIVLVKHLFSAKMAGIYAAVALVGRVIFSLSSAVVNTMFPLVAGTGEKERRDLRVIGTSLLLVVGTGSLLAIALVCVPPWVWGKCLGAGFEMAGAGNLSYLAALYAVKSVVYSISVVFVAFEMSHKIASSSVVQLAFSVVLMAGVYELHSSLLQVILVQLVLLSVLVVLTWLSFLNDIRSSSDEYEVPGPFPVHIIRKVTEDEVIGEFLKSDVGGMGTAACPASLREIVVRPNFADAHENARRRALLLLRHLSLWNEIPGDTSWYEVNINQDALERVRVFPRAQWRKLAHGDFSVPRITEGLRLSQVKLNPRFLTKITAIGRKLTKQNAQFGAVILLGLSADKPVTVLDGNHRLVAAMLSSAEELGRLRFMCGLSPRMAECCWYKTDLQTLARYGWHLVKAAICNTKAGLLRSLELPERSVAIENDRKPEITSLVEADDARS
jgi:O-antigen/teichoic acid export membrane protein